MTNKQFKDASVAVAQSDDLEDLLHNIAWEETIQPALHSRRAYYQNQLVASVLGSPVIDQQTGTIIPKEVLAGRIDGIDWIEKFFTNILRRGDKAAEALKHEQLYINNNN